MLAAVAALAAVATHVGARAQTPPACTLANGIQHVVYFQLDSTYYDRTAPNVPSDLEQMPSLMGFLTQNGSLFTNDHTVLTARGVGGSRAALTGLYPDRNPSAPPWLTFNRAGCNVGLFGIAGAGITVHCAEGSACPAADACLNDTSGEPIHDKNGNCGFPGADQLVARNTLGAVQQLLETGVQVTFAAIAAPHKAHPGGPFPPGDPGYVAQLQAYDAAFAEFFASLAAHGMDKTNTLFVSTGDEGGHFAGAAGRFGEVALDVRHALPRRPAFHLRPGSTAAFTVRGRGVRAIERAAARLRSTDPYIQRKVKVAAALAGRVEERLLHMGPAPTFTVFTHPDFLLAAAPVAGPTAAWTAGDVQQDVRRTWLGIVGPAVQQRGIDFSTWTDHTNLRPTLLALVGLRDDYAHDGHVLLPALLPQNVPPQLARAPRTMRRLGAVYDQLNAPFGSFAMTTLTSSSEALASRSAGDAKYRRIETALGRLRAQRDALAQKIAPALDAAAFRNRPLRARTAARWTAQSYALIAHALALRLRHGLPIP